MQLLFEGGIYCFESPQISTMAECGVQRHYSYRPRATELMRQLINSGSSMYVQPLSELTVVCTSAPRSQLVHFLPKLPVSTHYCRFMPYVWSANSSQLCHWVEAVVSEPHSLELCTDFRTEHFPVTWMLVLHSSTSSCFFCPIAKTSHLLQSGLLWNISHKCIISHFTVYLKVVHICSHICILDGTSII